MGVGAESVSNTEIKTYKNSNKERTWRLGKESKFSKGGRPYFRTLPNLK